MSSKIKDLVDNFIYEPDKKTDTWNVLEKNKDGKYVGDCEDFALTYHYLMCNQNWILFWLHFFIMYSGVLYVEDKRGEGHVFLRKGFKFIDNNYKTWISLKEIKERGDFKFTINSFLWTILSPIIIPLKMISTKIRRKFK